MRCKKFSGARETTAFEQFLKKQTRVLSNPAATLPDKEKALRALKLATGDLQSAISRTRESLRKQLEAGAGNPHGPLQAINAGMTEEGDVGMLYHVDRMRTLISEQGCTPEEAITQLLEEPVPES